MNLRFNGYFHCVRDLADKAVGYVSADAHQLLNHKDDHEGDKLGSNHRDDRHYGEEPSIAAKKTRPEGEALVLEVFAGSVQSI